jgi:hypothetical protein
MPSEAYVGRVGGLVVALVVGVAILTGWNSGVAWSDEPGGTAGKRLQHRLRSAEGPRRYQQ